MSKTYLLVSSLVIGALGAAGVLLITLLGGQPAGERTWAEIPARIRFLAGDGYRDWVGNAGPTWIDREVTRVYELAATHALVAQVMFGVMVLAALLGLLRLRVRGPVVLGVLLLVLALLGGTAYLVATDGLQLAMVVASALGVASLALLVTANLMPDVTHPFVQLAEREYLALPARQRRRYVITRVGGGLALVVLGVAATLGSFVFAAAIGGGVAIVTIGALAGGASMALMPMLAATRVYLRRR